MRLRFLRTILVLSMATALVIAYPLYAWGSHEVNQAVIAAGAIALANIVLGFISLEYGIDKSTTVFLIAVFGGMGLRMALVLVAVAVLVSMGFHQTGLVLSLMGFYVLFMVAEITYVVRELGKRSAEERAARKRKRADISLLTVSL